MDDNYDPHPYQGGGPGCHGDAIKAARIFSVNEAHHEVEEILDSILAADDDVNAIIF